MLSTFSTQLRRRVPRSIIVGTNESKRWISALYRVSVPRGGKTSTSPIRQDDVDHAVGSVRRHDPAGYLPGRLLPAKRMQVSYYAARGFWVETGLRFGTTARVPPNATPMEHLDWWQRGIDDVFDPTKPPATHPTLRLLHSILNEQQVPWKKQHFDDILTGRRNDLDVKQYETLDQLVKHAQSSCGSLLKLVLESGDVLPETSPACYRAAELVGACHGLSNALRTSIPVVSITGKLIVPADLTRKYGVKSPRYLLSALGLGDERCVRALQRAVKDIAAAARVHLQRARELRDTVLQEPGGERAVAALLPAVASETFLNRLEGSDYLLTDRNLRNVGASEHALCAFRTVRSYYQKTY